MKHIDLVFQGEKFYFGSQLQRETVVVGETQQLLAGKVWRQEQKAGGHVTSAVSQSSEQEVSGLGA